MLFVSRHSDTTVLKLGNFNPGIFDVVVGRPNSNIVSIFNLQDAFSERWFWDGVVRLPSDFCGLGNLLVRFPFALALK